ncbi:MAG: GreA/GreB family elongation factor, partial [Anaerovorax sp.]
TIVGATEADPYEGKISNESAVGAGLLGKKIGEIAEIQVPDGIVQYEIIKISKIS